MITNSLQVHMNPRLNRLITIAAYSREISKVGGKFWIRRGIKFAGQIL